MKSHYRAGDPMLNVYLGIDVGSTTTKLVALGSDGTIHASYLRKGVRLENLVNTLLNALDKYRSTAALLIRRSPGTMIQAATLTIMLFAAKFFLAWLVVLSLGVRADVFTVFAVHALLHFIVYLAPSPGGSGVAEIGTGALMAIVLPAALLGPFTLIYRALLVYLPSVGGAAVLFTALSRHRNFALESESESSVQVTPISRPVSVNAALESVDA